MDPQVGNIRGDFTCEIERSLRCVRYVNSDAVRLKFNKATFLVTEIILANFDRVIDFRRIPLIPRW